MDNQERSYDILIYGATGFTGKRVARYVVENHPNLKVAIAGRSLTKLQLVAEELDLPSSCGLLEAPLCDDESDPNSKSIALHSVLSQSRVVLACAGPYRQCGERLVRVAIECHTDYLDLCGEPQFFDDMLVRYDESARQNRTLILSACAFDCVPAELTYALACQTLRERYHTDATAVEILHTVQNVSCGNATTFHAAVDGFHASITGELSKSRRMVKQQWGDVVPPKNPKALQNPSPSPSYTIANPGILPSYHRATNTYALKFLGADASCILASDRYIRKHLPESPRSLRPRPRLSVCFGVPNQYAACKFVSFGAIFSTLARYRWGCNLLHSYPEYFTNGFFRQGGPTQEELDKGSFTTHCVAVGTGVDHIVRVQCSGPEPGYVATPKMIVALALTVLNHRDSLPFQGGVMLPGALFGEFKPAYDNLEKEGIVFHTNDQEHE